MRTFFRFAHEEDKAKDLFIEKFGVEFWQWLEKQSDSANFFVAMQGKSQDVQWATFLCMGYAYLAGRDSNAK